MNLLSSPFTFWRISLWTIPLVAEGAWSWSMHREAAVEAASVYSLQVEQAQLDEAVSALVARRDELQRAVDQANTDRASREAAFAHRVPPPFGPHGNVYFPELLSDSHYAQVYRVLQRQRIEERFAPLFASLTLSFADLSRLKDLLLEKQMAHDDIDGVLENQTMGEGKAVDQLDETKVQTRVNRSFDEEIAQSFGDAVFARYRDFLAGTGPRQDFLDQLKLRLSYSKHPLEDAQADQLIKLATATRRAELNSGAAEKLSNAFVDAAQPILEPEQMPALLQIQAYLRANRVLGSSISVRRNPTAPPPIPSSSPH